MSKMNLVIVHQPGEVTESEKSLLRLAYDKIPHQYRKKGYEIVYDDKVFVIERMGWSVDKNEPLVLIRYLGSALAPSKIIKPASNLKIASNLGAKA